MPHPHLLVEHDPAGYRWLRLARPQRRNALSVSLTAAIRDALAAAEPSVPILLGSTDPGMFCAGADLTISDAERAEVGGGAQLAAASDLRIASPAARLRWVGPPGLNLTVGAWLLPDLVGRGPAMDLVLTGRWLEAAEALTLGLVNRVSPEPDVIAEQIAADLARRGVAAGTKPVMAAGGLLDRLQAERAANRSAWAQLTGPVPSPAAFEQ